MNKKFTKLIAAIALLVFMTPTMAGWGQEKGYTAYYTLTCAKNTSYNGYASYNDVDITDGDISMTWNAPGNQALGEYWRIGGAKGENVTRTITGKTAMGHSISKIVLNHNGVSNSNLTINSIAITISSSSNFATSNIIETITISNPSVSSSGYLTFEPNDVNVWAENCYYKITIEYSHNGSKNYGLDITSIVFNKTTYTITYNPNGATGGTVPTATVADAGSNATVASNTGSLEKTGFIFNCWNTQADGSGTDYAEGATINSIAQDYTLYAKWTAASSPNIVVSGDGISNNALNLAYTAAVNKTATASFNNMTGYTSPTVTLYNDLACSEIFSGNWLSASLSSSTITYSASANPGAARTVYMRVSAVYNNTTYYSNVITITQAALPCTVTYDKNNTGATGTVEDENSPYDYGSTVTVLANSFTAPTGKYFYKWNTASDGSGTYYEKDDTFTITGNTTLYAQWEDSPIYIRITSLSQIIPGAHYILARGITTDATTEVMDGQQSDYRDAKTTTTTVQNGDVDGDGNNDIYIQEAGLYEFIISGDVIVKISDVDYNSFTIYDKDNTGYLNNGLNVNTSALNNSSRWILEFDAANNYQIKIRNVNSTGNYMQFNKTLSRVKTYGGTQNNGYLYIKYNDKDCEIYSATTLSQSESYTNLTIVKTVVNNNTIVNGSVTVPNEKTLTVTGNLVNNGTAANLVIEDGGRLIVYNEGVQATVKKEINGVGDENWSATSGAEGWYFIASPVDGASFSTATTGYYDLYMLDWENEQWLNQKNDEHSALFANGFQRGTGYLYANKEDLNEENSLSFAGEIQPLDNEDKATVTLAVGGWNLIGNPLACKVTVDQAFSELNDEGSGLINQDLGSAINPCQGIAVYGDADDVVTFTKAASQEASTPSNKPSLQITLAQNIVTRGTATSNTVDNAVISFNEGSVLPKFNMLAGNAKLYIPQGNEEYAIVSTEGQGEMPVNFRANENGTYTLTVNAENVEMNYLHLIDNLTGANVDLLTNPSYTFNAKVTDYESRFKLVFVTNGASTDSETEETFAFFSNGQLVVGNEGEATLQVIDMLGRIVSTETINGSSSVNFTAPAGVYVIRLINGENVKTQKMVVR